MQKRTLLKSAAAVALLASSGVALAQGAPFKIGLILPMTGQQATTGRQIEAAARLWMAQNGDTVAGKKVQLILKDDTSVPDVTRRLAQELIVNEKVDVLRGTKSAAELDLIRKADRGKAFALVSPLITTPSIPVVWRIRPQTSAIIATTLVAVPALAADVGVSISIGEHKEVAVYVRGQASAAKKVGIAFEDQTWPATLSQEECKARLRAMLEEYGGPAQS